MQEAQGQSLVPHKAATVIPALGEPEGLENQGHSQVLRKLEASLVCLRSAFKERKQNKNPHD